MPKKPKLSQPAMMLLNNIQPHIVNSEFALGREVAGNNHAINMFDLISFAHKYNMTNLLQVFFEILCTIPSDKSNELVELNRLAKQCSRITEFNVGQGLSSIAFLLGLHTSKTPEKCALTAYDRRVPTEIAVAKELAPPVAFSFNKRDILDADIKSTDLLFIDGVADGNKLKKVLKLHGDKASKYIAIHDYAKFRKEGIWGSLGFDQVVADYINSGAPFSVAMRRNKGNGLIVLKRKESNNGNKKTTKTHS